VSWLAGNIPEVLTNLWTHLALALIPVVVGLIISVPLAWLAARYRIARRVLVALSVILYTIPSIVLLVIMPVVIGTQILSPVNVIVALTIYTVALLVPAIADALTAVPPEVLAAANAIGYRSVGRFFGVELPLAVPVLTAGLRVATVSNFSLVSVGSLVGIGGLGTLLTEGFQRYNTAEVVDAIVIIVVLALIFDTLLWLGGRLLTPWNRTRTGGAAT
jgi:osmoprotectant transport system permease protein